MCLTLAESKTATMSTGERKSDHGGAKALWDDLADDTKGQASILDACPFVFSYIIPKCFGAVAFAFCFSDRHQGYLSFSDFSEVYSSLNDAVFLLRLKDIEVADFQSSML